MNGHDRAGPESSARAAQNGLQFLRVHAIGVVDIDQKRSGPRLLDRGHGGDRGMGNRDHGMPGADPQRPQRQDQSIGAAGHSDPVGGSAEGREVRFERIDLVSENVVAASERAPDGGVDLVPVREVARPGIGLRNARRVCHRPGSQR